MSKTRNPVAKHMDEFNKPSRQRDRKNDYQRKAKHGGPVRRCRYCHEVVDLAPLPGAPQDVCDGCLEE